MPKARSCLVRVTYQLKERETEREKESVGVAYAAPLLRECKLYSKFANGKWKQNDERAIIKLLLHLIKLNK